MHNSFLPQFTLHYKPIHSLTYIYVIILIKIVPGYEINRRSGIFILLTPNQSHCISQFYELFQIRLLKLRWTVGARNPSATECSSASVTLISEFKSFNGGQSFRRSNPRFLLNLLEVRPDRNSKFGF